MERDDPQPGCLRSAREPLGDQRFLARVIADLVLKARRLDSKGNPSGMRYVRSLGREESGGA
jgi:hypothetical protein